MWKLLTHDCNGSTESCQYGHSERGTDGQAVYEVVYSVTQCYHPGNGLDVGNILPTQPVTGHSGHLDILRIGK